MQLFPRRQVDRSILISVPAATWTTRLFWRTVQPGEITCRRESGSEKMKVTLRIRPARFVRDSTQLLSNCPFWISSDLSRKKKRLVQCSYGRLPSLLWMMEAKRTNCPEAEHKFRINVSHLYKTYDITHRSLSSGPRWSKSWSFTHVLQVLACSEQGRRCLLYCIPDARFRPNARLKN